MPCQWSSLRGGRKKKPKKKTFVGYSAARFQCEIVSQLSAGGGVAEAAEAVVVTLAGLLGFCFCLGARVSIWLLCNAQLVG
uniref:Uncharacterized protein n=1 Tax=Oryza sativa subsp. japonica TaxID=39947 RepID=Q6K234_ORYSJ|nr:hypothetical protein [Oryza sativa Japonica Group]BAD20124.1 hypothetical protein [Oryza sativa Japonica Group]